MIIDLQASDLPWVFQGGGGILHYPLGNLYKPSGVTNVITNERIVEGRTFNRTTSGSGATTLNTTNTPIAGTISIFYTDLNGNRFLVPLQDISFSGTTTTVIGLPFSEDFRFTIEYSYLGPDVIRVVKSGENASIANRIPLAADTQVTTLNSGGGSGITFTGYIVEHL